MTASVHRLKQLAAVAVILSAGVALGLAMRPEGNLAGAAPGPGGGGRAAAGMLPAITTEAVQPSIVEKRINAVGVGRAAKSVTLISEATGLVTEVNFRPGEKVAAGAVLLQIDDAEQRIALARLDAQFPIAKENADRYAGLLESGAGSRLESEIAFNAFKALEAERNAAAYAVSQRTIRAPFEGVVGLTTIEPGDYVRAGEVATTIDDLSSIIIEFAAPQESAADVKLGQGVTAVLAANPGARVEGVITAVDTRVDPASRTLKVEATFTNAGGGLIPGATYEVTTTNEGAKALSMPGLAVQWDRTGAYVWKLTPDGAVERASLRILQRRDEIVIAEGDLSAGDRIIVEGADRVRPGMTFPSAAPAVGSG